MLLAPCADARPSCVNLAILEAAAQMEREASEVAKRIERTLRALAPTWDPDQRWAIAYEMDEVFSPCATLRQNARAFYDILPITRNLPRATRAFIAMGAALGAVRYA